MATVKLIKYEESSSEVRAIYDDIRKTRGAEFINNFWLALANNPEQLDRTWNQVKTIMKGGALDPLTKELIYIAVSVANSCEYCIHSHTASAKKKGLTDEQYKELLEVIGLAHHTNGLVSTMQVDVDESFKQQ
ncbi:MAG: alkylhydroperoxidase [Methylococcaceae bacterium TMED69]|nr:MAG: alkylhydroperoxidase [Methylococcaceae bacterium TMED69]|tara:strand:- start:2345 stop:2743 length:399 start_codon:yes stop_codon:yes gene_type:complete